MVIDAAITHRSFSFGNFAFFLLKIALTATCFWYVSRSVGLDDIVRFGSKLHPEWVGLAILAMIIQIPLTGLRWIEILYALTPSADRIARGPVIAVTAIGVFFGQVAPNIVGDTARAWLITRLGQPWRPALVSVLIDRAVGFAVLLAIAFCVLALPSGLTALVGYRATVLEFFGCLLFIGMLGLGLAPQYAPMLIRWRGTRWFGQLALASRNVLLSFPAGVQIFGISILVHGTSIVCVWSLGKAQGFDLPVIDAAVLFALMVGVSLVPITISGWGLRELAVTTFLRAHGVAPEKALFLSVSFGLVLLIAALPGAVMWAFYTPGRPILGNWRC